MSHDISKVAEAEAVANTEGNMCGTVMRGIVAPPGSQTRSRSQGRRWNLGGLIWSAVAWAIPDRDRNLMGTLLGNR